MVIIGTFDWCDDGCLHSLPDIFDVKRSLSPTPPYEGEELGERLYQMNKKKRAKRLVLEE